MAGGLFDPLGTPRAPQVRRGIAVSAPTLLLTIALAGVAALAATAWFRDDGDRGRPRAVSTIVRVPGLPASPPPAAPPVAPVAPPPSVPASPPVAPLPPVLAPPVAQIPPPTPLQRDDLDVEIQNGVRVVRPRKERPPTSGQTIKVPSGADQSLR